ncbi:MAG: winged helix-turn-helix domain-containing protein [Planctomycetota bacterium]
MADRKTPFDPMLLSQVRLGIISVLVSRRNATFTALKDLLNLTQGNLTIHLKKLEKAGYVAVKKDFVARKPRTMCRITAKGRKAFLAHLEQLQAIAEGFEKD